MHDSKGNPLKVGDHVTIPFQIRDLSSNEKDCNCTLVSVDTPAYSEAHRNASNVVVTTNTKMATKVAAVILCLFLSALCCASAEAACLGCARGVAHLSGSRPVVAHRGRRARRVEARTDARAQARAEAGLDTWK